MRRLILILVCAVVIGSRWVLPARAAQPELRRVDDLYQGSTPKDSDFDGLTDQGETKIFSTDPAKPDTDGDGYLDGAEIMIGSNPNDVRDPTADLIAVQQPAATSPWPWYVARATGIISYVLLFLMTLIGISISTGLLFRLLSPSTAWALHRSLGITLFISVLLHPLALLFDKFINLRLVDVLIPFASPFKPLFVTLGIFGLYLLLSIIYTSLFTITKHARFWRYTHYLSFPMFVLIFIHGTLIGTDRHQPLMVGLYWSTGIIIGFLVLYRLFWTLRAYVTSKS